MLNIAQKRRFRRFSLHTKVVLTMTVFLLLAGTLLLHVTQDGLTWMQSFFYSAVTRTSGFSIYNLGDFSNASLLCMALLMFVGAAPGSTGGGIKVTTLFVCASGLPSPIPGISIPRCSAGGFPRKSGTRR